MEVVRTSETLKKSPPDIDKEYHKQNKGDGVGYPINRFAGPAIGGDLAQLSIAGMAPGFMKQHFDETLMASFDCKNRWFRFLNPLHAYVF